MAKLILMFGERVLREIPVGAEPVTIGRLPDNMVVIDNPAVSGHHARVLVEGGVYIVEDLQSRNGTFVNGQRITRQALGSGDVVLVGKHNFVFEDAGKEEALPAAAPPPAPALPDLGGTVFLDTKAHKEMLAKLGAAAPARAAVAPAAVLTVVSGATSKREYTLDVQTALIGKSSTALVQLQGWLKPDLAASITRRENRYVLTPLKGKTQVNKQPVTGPCELQPGDVIEVSGVVMQFNLKT